MSLLSDCELYYSPDAGNYLIQYIGNYLDEISKIDYACGSIFTESLGLLVIREEDIARVRIDVPSIIYIDIRYPWVLQDTSPNYIDNINNIKLNPYLDLTGRGVIVGLIDTGIDYLNKEFIREDGTSKILSLWDQNYVDASPQRPVSISQDDFIPYQGKIFTNQQINEAILASKNNQDPYQIVPSKDTRGHGTKAASIIGAKGYDPDVKGIADDCDFIVVKLFESTNFKRAMIQNGIQNPPATYNSSEVVAALQYLRHQQALLDRPLVIYLGVGTNFGSHDGSSIMEAYVTSLTYTNGLCIVSGVGNQGAASGHASGFISGVDQKSTQQLRIPKELKSLSFGIWIQRPNRASLNIISPTGESTNIIKSKINSTERYNFVFTNTQVLVRFFTPEYYSGHDLIYIDFLNIKPGIWTFELIGEYITDGKYNIWIPPYETLPENLVFLTPDNLTTLQKPSTAINTITVAYLGADGSINSASGKGFSSNNIINPDLSTIGEGIITTSVGGSKTTFSGSSAATAVIVAASALLLQWGIVNKNDVSLYTQKIKTYLVYGCTRRDIYNYPSRDIGYGEFNLLGTFDIIGKIYPRSSPRLTRDYENFIETDFNNLFFRIPKSILEDLNEQTDRC